jgi:hypothetical protein
MKFRCFFRSILLFVAVLTPISQVHAFPSCFLPFGVGVLIFQVIYFLQIFQAETYV